MTPRGWSLALVVALAALPARAQRVELVPESVIPSAPGASALSAAPAPFAAAPVSLAASAPVMAAPAAFAAPAALPPAAAPALAPAAAIPAAAAAASVAAPGTAPSPAARAANAVQAVLGGAAALPPSGAPNAAERDFSGDAEFDGAAAHAPAALPAASAPDAAARPTLEPAARPAKAPTDAERMAATIPGWMSEELPVTMAKLGRPVAPEYIADVLARSNVWVYKWHSRWTYEISGGLPDGHYDPKFGIRVMLKTDWRRLKDPQTHFRVLFAHEYTHWLQNEGVVTRRYGGEIPAVAVEQLRAMELVGWEGMKAGKIGFIAEGNLGAFEGGREWARGDMKDETQLMFRGVLGGAAYEVGVIAGRPEAAWEFLNLVIAEKGGLKPREAFERVTGLKK